jgi:hypothetical protein
MVSARCLAQLSGFRVVCGPKVVVFRRELAAFQSGTRIAAGLVYFVVSSGTM